jgi:hypothetical protein
MVDMFSSLGSTGYSVLQQTSSLMMGRQSMSVAQLSSLSSPAVAFQSTTPSSSGEVMVQNLAQEKSSADSAVELLSVVHGRMQEALGSGNVEQWQDLKAELQATRLELATMEAEGRSTASGRKVYSSVAGALEEAVGALGRAVDLGTERGMVGLQRSAQRVLSSLSQVTNLSSQLEQASLQVYQIQSAYASSGMGLASSSFYQASESASMASSGRLFDWVS